MNRRWKSAVPALALTLAAGAACAQGDKAGEMKGMMQEKGMMKDKGKMQGKGMMHDKGMKDGMGMKHGKGMQGGAKGAEAKPSAGDAGTHDHDAKK